MDWAVDLLSLLGNVRAGLMQPNTRCIVFSLIPRRLIRLLFDPRFVLVS